LETQ
jgi:hypothetical protein